MLITKGLGGYVYDEIVTYEAISPAFAGLSVGDDDGFLDVPEDGEMFPQRLVRRVVGQSADE